MSDYELGTGGSGGSVGGSGGTGGSGTGGTDSTTACVATESIDPDTFPFSMTTDFEESSALDIGNCSFDTGIGRAIAWMAPVDGAYRVSVTSSVPVALSAFDLVGGECSGGHICDTSADIGAGGGAGASAAGGAAGAASSEHSVSLSLSLSDSETVALVVSADTSPAAVEDAEFTLTIAEQ